MKGSLLSPAVIQKVLDTIQKTYRCGYQLAKQPKREKVLIDYSSPNIAKPFHAGHLRSTLIGNFVAKINSTVGHEVVRINYLGDWGLQFGLLGAGFKRYGSETQLADNPIKHLFDVYVEANKMADKDPVIEREAREFIQSMEQGDSNSLNLWQRFRQYSIEDYIKTYKRLGIEFDEYSGESQYWNKTPQLLEELTTKGLLQTTQKGTQIVDLSDMYTGHSSYATLARSDGTSLYLTRDITAAIDRYDHHKFDRMYYVVDKSQVNHFKQLVGVLRKMGYSWANRIHHIQFGRVTGMKTRRGEVVFLADILDEARTRMLHNMQVTDTTKQLDDPDLTAEQLGISAVILQDFARRLSKDYKFDWDRLLQSQGNTGIFLQYTHARLYSLEQQAGFPLPSSVESIDTSHLGEPEAVDLVAHIAQLDSIVLKAYQEMEPHVIVKYLLQLGHLVSSAHKKLRVKDSPIEIAQARLILFNSARLTLAHGMDILGMKPVNQM
ncbi:probable arginine--tRNA ligase, mitochondrial [Amphiura filiformis]|uniref:probable arginine--tRNA ligase, mitochondrial n=1 Tax=Amphiura filiformis TaxID=82378 RepID=UPI003B20C8A5